MSRPWMPMYWRDYLADTPHLTLAQHGAYLLLIAHYWNHGSVPRSALEMSRLLRIRPKQMLSIWQAIAPFFDENGRHKRIDAELEKYRVLSEKRAFAGRKGGLMSRGLDNNGRFVAASISQAIAKQTGGQPQPHKKTKKEAGEEGLAAIVRAKGWT